MCVCVTKLNRFYLLKIKQNKHKHKPKHKICQLILNMVFGIRISIDKFFFCFVLFNWVSIIVYRIDFIFRIFLQKKNSIFFIIYKKKNLFVAPVSWKLIMITRIFLPNRVEFHLNSYVFIYLYNLWPYIPYSNIYGIYIHVGVFFLQFFWVGFLAFSFLFVCSFVWNQM